MPEALEKVVPAFEGIAEDAERAAEAEYERLGSMPYDDQIDMSDVAEMAKDHGITVYKTMSGVRQVTGRPATLTRRRS